MRARPACLLAIPLLVGCFCPGRTAPRRPPRCAAVADLLTPQGRLAAMISVHANALGGQEASGALALTRAATVLECDLQAGTAGSRSRKRRAVAELAAFGRLRDFDDALEVLRVDQGTLRSALQRRYPSTWEYLVRNPAVLELIISNLIREDAALGGLPPTDGSVPGPVDQPSEQCDWIQEKPFDVWHTGPVITVDGAVSVALPRSEVRRNLDPQRWDECSHLWDPPPETTRLVTKTGSGTFHEMPAGSIPAPGSDYGYEALYERFSCNAPGCLAWFENLLQVKVQKTKLPSTPSSKGVLVNYNLPSGDGLNGCVGDASTSCAAGTKVLVKTDQGWLEIWRESGRTMIVTHKEVLFDNAVANGISEALFAHAELARELGEMACCLKAAEP